MKGDLLYLGGTAMQLVAFVYGMRVPTMGFALVAYGLGLVVCYQVGRLR